MSRMHLPPVDKTRSYADQLVWPCGSADAGVGPVGGAPKGKPTPGGATCVVPPAVVPPVVVPPVAAPRQTEVGEPHHQTSWTHHHHC